MTSRRRTKPTVCSGTSAGRRKPWKSESMALTCSMIALKSARFETLSHRNSSSQPSAVIIWRTDCANQESDLVLRTEIESGLVGGELPPSPRTITFRPSSKAIRCAERTGHWSNADVVPESGARRRSGVPSASVRLISTGGDAVSTLYQILNSVFFLDYNRRNLLSFIMAQPRSYRLLVGSAKERRPAGKSTSGTLALFIAARAEVY